VIEGGERPFIKPFPGEWCLINIIKVKMARSFLSGRDLHLTITVNVSKKCFPAYERCLCGPEIVELEILVFFPFFVFKKGHVLANRGYLKVF